MKTLKSLILLLLFLNASHACSSNNKKSFEEFRLSFFTDSVFQKSRIVFPLPGINTDEMDIDDTTSYFWKESDWKFMLKEIDMTGLKKEVNISDSIVTEKIYQEDSGFSILFKFQLINANWYLVRYEIINI